MTPEQKLSKAKIALMRDPKFMLYSGLLVMGKCTVLPPEEYAKVSPMMTACTDGYNEWWNSEFIESLSIKQLSFIAIHEVLHKAYKHFQTYKRLFEEDAMRANYACDYVINLDIMSTGSKTVELPPGVLYDEQYAGMSSKQVFDLLKGKKLPQPSNGDAHILGKFTPEQTKAIEVEVERALRQGRFASNAAGGDADLSIDELLAPKVKWQDQLREWANENIRGGNESSWRRPNRRFLHEDVYMPTSVDRVIKEVIIAVDVSGSIGREQLTEFFSEVTAIAANKIRVLYWDTDVTGDEIFTDVESLKELKGGGGTDPSCILPYIQEKGYNPEGIIVLTDGEFSHNNCFEYKKLLWAVFGSKELMPTGVTINIMDDEEN